MALRVSLSDKHSLIVLLVSTGGILACACAYVAYLNIRHRLRTRTGRSWPSAEATVQFAEVASSLDNAKPDETPSTSVFGDRGSSISSGTRYATTTWMVRVTYSSFSGRGILRRLLLLRGFQPGSRRRIRAGTSGKEIPSSVQTSKSGEVDRPGRRMGRRDSIVFRVRGRA
jgi:hypothetical protein